MKLWPFTNFKWWPFLGYPSTPLEPVESSITPEPAPEPPKQPSFGKLVLADLLKYPVEEWQFKYSTAYSSTYQTVAHPKVPYKLFTDLANSDRSYVSVLELEGNPFSDFERFEIFQTLKRIQMARWKAEDEKKKANDILKIQKWYPNAKV